MMCLVEESTFSPSIKNTSVSFRESRGETMAVELLIRVSILAPRRRLTESEEEFHQLRNKASRESEQLLS